MDIKKFDGNPLPLPFSPVVRVSIPARAAYDLASFQKSIGNLAERLGCPQCLSGANCLFELERDFLINDKLDVVPRQF